MAQVAAQHAKTIVGRIPLEADGPEERRRADKLMADFAAAFSLEMDFEQDVAEGEEKWPMGWTIAFALSVSALLWSVLAAVFYFV
jgi:hypothetical protein